jgi:hypothetical protein
MSVLSEAVSLRIRQLPEGMVGYLSEGKDGSSSVLLLPIAAWVDDGVKLVLLRRDLC